MIQRKQSIWLLLAALFNSSVFFVDMYKVHTVTGNIENVVTHNVYNDWPGLGLAVLMTVMPLITIFMFKDRKRQLRMCTVSAVATVSFLSRLLMHAKADPPSTLSYGIGSILPVVALVFIILAILGIKSDEKLVKSQDRLR